MKLSTESVLFGASVTAVIGAVVTGLFIMGSPSEERARRLDNRRVADLHGIAVATDLYWTRHSRLPGSLDDLAAEAGVRISIADPVTSEIYGYQPLDSIRYELCAHFERDSDEDAGGGPQVPTLIQEGCQTCHRLGLVTPSRVGERVVAHGQLRNLWAHGSGRQCFQFQAVEFTSK